MAIQQREPVVPPKPSDRMLQDFAQIIQDSFKSLYLVAHVHRVVTATPTMRDGDVGDIYLLDVTGAKKICVKFSDGWYGVAVTRL